MTVPLVFWSKDGRLSDPVTRIGLQIDDGQLSRPWYSLEGRRAGF